MNRGKMEAFCSKRGVLWLGMALAYRQSAEMAKGYRADPDLIRNHRLSMRTSAYKMRAELLIERMDRRAVA